MLSIHLRATYELVLFTLRNNTERDELFYCLYLVCHLLGQLDGPTAGSFVTCWFVGSRNHPLTNEVPLS